jgi:hypothetical protein
MVECMVEGLSVDYEAGLSVDYYALLNFGLCISTEYWGAQYFFAFKNATAILDFQFRSIVSYSFI